MEVEVDGEVFSVRIVSVGGSKMEVASVTQQKAPRGEIAGGVKSNMQGMVLQVLGKPWRYGEERGYPPCP